MDKKCISKCYKNNTKNINPAYFNLKCEKFKLIELFNKSLDFHWHSINVEKSSIITQKAPQDLLLVNDAIYHCLPNIFTDTQLGIVHQG